MEPETYFISYASNSGIINESYVNQYTVVDEITLPTDVTRDNYYFKGWYDNEELTGSPVESIPVGSIGNRQFYAKWEKHLHLYSVTVKINTEIYTPEGLSVLHDENPGGVVTGAGQYELDTTVRLYATPNDGYEFKWWLENENDNPVKEFIV